MAALFECRRTGRNARNCLGSATQAYKLFFFSFFAVSFALTILVSAKLSAAPSNIQLLESTPTTARIRFVNCSDFSTLSVDQIKTSEVVYSRTVQIAIPPNGSARIVGANGSKARGIKLALAGHATVGRLASLGEPIIVRGKTLVSLTVYPVSSSGVFDEIEVTVSFEGQDVQADLISKPDPLFERIFGGNVLNLEQMKAWGTLSTVSKSRSQTDLAVSLSGDWIKLFVNQTGLHSVSGAQLEQAGLSLVGLLSDDVRIFNAGGLRINMPNEQPRPLFDEIATMVNDGGDGLFGPSDRIYFYGEAVDRWLYPEGSFARFENNVYTEFNVYWIPVSGVLAGPPLRMVAVDGSPSGTADTIISEIWGRAHAEKDSLLLVDSRGYIDDYYRWFWSNSASLSLFVNTPGLIAGEDAKVNISARSGGVISASFNQKAGSPDFCNRFACGFITNDLYQNGLNQVDLTLSPDGSSKPGFDYLDITYRRSLTPESNRIQFVTENVNGVAEIALVDNFSGTPIVFDLTDPANPVRITGGLRSSGLFTFRSDLSVADWNHFLVTELAQAYSPAMIESIQIIDLRSVARQVDMFIVTSNQFAGALDEYVQYRESDSMSIMVVTVEDIMDNFGFGLYDPAAIRDFFKYAYENYTAPAPAIALMVGDANHDFLDVMNTGVPNIVPAFIHYRPSIDISYSDDNFVYFDKYGILDSDTSLTRIGDGGVDMLIARWPITSVSELDRIVDRIKQYESPANFGFWRSRITLVADDEYGGDFNNETFHTTDSEKLDTLYIPRAYNRDKIYLIEYPRVGSDKPAVNDAIVNSFNRGSLIVNYVGHGNPDVWAHEHVFRRGSDIPRLDNYDMLPLVFAASCAIAFFDDPKREGMAEDFLVMPGGGAIGVISPTRLVYAGDNAQFNRAVFDILFNEPELTLCEAMFSAKLRRQYLNDTTMYPVRNDRAYAFFGDPLLNLGVPGLGVVFDEQPDTLVALSRHHVAGHLVDRDGQPVNVDGELFVNLYDSDRSMTYYLTSSPGVKVDYTMPGPTLFRGRASVSQGEFAFDFVTPLDVGFGGQRAKLSAYSIHESSDGIGATGPLVISDQVTVSSDTTGPAVEFSFSSHANFISGDRIGSNERLELILSDSSGINLAGGLGHGIVLEVDSDPSATVVLNDLFEYDTDDFTTGKIAYSLENIEVGVHQFKIRVWDNANNSTTTEFSADIVSSVGLSIADLLNYPNPMNKSTTFYFVLVEPTERFVLDIFTLSGRRIRSFNRTDLPADNYPNEAYALTWDGRDADGDRVATGVYIYKATAQSSLSGETVESFGKIIVIN